VKFFEQRELKAAFLHAEQGGQALHLCRSAQFVGPSAPACFKRSKQFAHLIDHDVDRLMATARRLGVRVVKVERGGRPGQHVDLCGKPLERAITEAKTPELSFAV
jgi:hypothetical protein